MLSAPIRIRIQRIPFRRVTTSTKRPFKAYLPLGVSNKYTECRTMGNNNNNNNVVIYNRKIIFVTKMYVLGKS